MHNDAPARKPSRKTSYLYYGVIFLAALVALIWQFIFPGYYNKIPEDAAYTHKYIIQFMGSFREEVIYPRWMPGEFGGYGSPVFVYYSPLLYFLAAVLGLAGLGISSSVAVLKLLGICTGGIFLFYLVRARIGERAALLAAILYVLLPTQILTLYTLNTPAARFGEAFMPMSMYFMDRLMESGFSRRWLFWLAVSYSALILSHLATAYLFTPFLMAYGLTACGKGLKEAAPGAAMGLAAGILLSSFFFVPVLFEQNHVQLGLLRHYYERKLFLFSFSAAASQFDTLLTNTILMESITAAAFLFISVRQKSIAPDKWITFMAVSAAACLLMMSPLSYWVWEYLPGMHSVAFPYRFMLIYIILVAVLLGAGLDGLLHFNAGAGLFAGMAAFLFLAVLLYDAQLIMKSMPPVSETSAEKIAEGNEMLEYLPAAVNLNALPALKKYDPSLSSEDSFTYRVVRWGYIDRLFAVDSPQGARLRVKTFYFPGWRAWVDGKEVPLRAQEKTGAILMDIPPGRHDVELKFTDTPPRTIGKMVSLLMFIGLVFPYGWLRPARKKA